MLSEEERKKYLEQLLMFDAGKIKEDELSCEIFSDKDLAIEFANVSRRGYGYLGLFSEYVRSDKDVVLAFVKHDWYELSDVPSFLLNDKEVIMTAFKSLDDGYEAMRFASDDLKKDSEFIMLLIKHDYRVFKYADEVLKNDKVFVSKVLQINGLALRFASDDLKEDFDIIKIAVKQNPFAFAYASIDVQETEWMVSELYEINPNIIYFASGNIQEKYAAQNSLNNGKTL